MSTDSPGLFAGSALPGIGLPTPIVTRSAATQNNFLPVLPDTLFAAGLEPRDLYPLIIRFLYLHGYQSGAAIARQLKLPYGFIEPVLHSLKADQWIAHKGSAPGNDYVFELGPKGHEQARLYLDRSTYCGAAPVSVEEYSSSVMRQTIRNLKPNPAAINAAFSDLVVSRLLLGQLGQAISSGKACFLFGPPGNGKSALATRITRAIDPCIWIPRALSVGGEVIRIYDPAVHEQVPVTETLSVPGNRELDERWVRILRPTITVGGELTLEHLEATLNPVSRIIEAPVHVKSNGGCLVIDDFGRQRISPEELLNRWIVPMDRHIDFINLPTGRQISLPFEQILVFATNLAPEKLCDEAFMRRIPYKIEVFDPTEAQFRGLFENKRQQMGFEFQPGIIDYLIEYHYKRASRPFRFCQVGDLLEQARDFCEFHGKPLVFNRDIAEIAILNYFSGT